VEVVHVDEDLADGPGLLGRPGLARRGQAVDEGDLPGGAGPGVVHGGPLARVHHLAVETLPAGRRREGVGQPSTIALGRPALWDRLMWPDLPADVEAVLLERASM
jgi:hypothetical protein